MPIFQSEIMVGLDIIQIDLKLCKYANVSQVMLKHHATLGGVSTPIPRTGGTRGMYVSESRLSSKSGALFIIRTFNPALQKKTLLRGSD